MDDERRELERRAKAGDEHAAMKLRFLLARAGELDERQVRADYHAQVVATEMRDIERLQLAGGDALVGDRYVIDIERRGFSYSVALSPASSPGVVVHVDIERGRGVFIVPPPNGVRMIPGEARSMQCWPLDKRERDAIVRERGQR